MYNLLLAWAAFVGVAVFVLYVRDPRAAGRHRSRLEAHLRSARTGMRRVCEGLRDRGLCPIG